MGNFCRDTKGYHYTIPEAFDPSLSYDMQYQRLRNIVLKIIDEMEINVPYLIMTKVTHTNDSITITGSLYQDYKFVSLNNTFSLVGLGDGTYYLNLNNRHKYAPCDKDIVSVPFEGTMYVSTQYMPKDELTLYSITKENGVVTSVEYNDIYTGMHNIAEDAHENRFSDVYAKIQAEIDRATSAEETLDKKIENETDRAETSESAIDDKIEAETQRATSKETELQNNITAETNRATAKENQLSAAITAEQQRAEQAEQQITNAVNTEVQNRTAAVTEERERAIAAENAITENMTNLVDTEKDRAIAAENSVRTDMTNLVDTEKDRAIAAENSITEDMTNLVETEKDRAIAAEENLQSQFNNWEAQLDGVEAKVDGKQDKIGNVQGNATDMEITGIPATNSIAFKGENGDILAVKTKAPASPTDAVTKEWLDTEVELINNSLDELDTKITAETGRATQKENELNTKITNEINRATQVENAIKEDVNGILLTNFPVTATTYSDTDVPVTAAVRVLKFNKFALIQVNCRSNDRSTNFNQIKVDLSSLSPSLNKNAAFGSAGYMEILQDTIGATYHSWPVTLRTDKTLIIGNSLLTGYRPGDATVYATAILFF